MKKIHSPLTRRQAEATDLLLLDLNFQDIADRMRISKVRVKELLKEARDKLRARTRVGLALRWQQYRMFQPKRRDGKQ
jgi:DNA-binding CsgD family transcriptional regulator